MTTREIKQIVSPQSVLEGAGVRLKRSFPTHFLDYPDPFLLFDHFGSDDPADYLAGFPMHPHRGIETVTYMLAGQVEHRDSLGNGGMIEAGDMQWMTAGRGILHEEMPKPVQGAMEGFQLWVNLPARLKMTRPHYQGVLSSQIPAVETHDGALARLIAGGLLEEASGPVAGIAAQPVYMDIELPAGKTFSISTPPGHTVLVYLYRGQALSGAKGRALSAPVMIRYEPGDMLSVSSASEGTRFLVMMGEPMGEPIFRYGPFVMNTRAEIEQTLRELQDGTFIQP